MSNNLAADGRSPAEIHLSLNTPEHPESSGRSPAETEVNPCKRSPAEPHLSLFEFRWPNQCYDYADGDTNIIWSFMYFELQWPPQFSIQWFRYDGLPIRCLKLGLFVIGWGQSHVWLSRYGSLEEAE